MIDGICLQSGDGLGPVLEKYEKLQTQVIYCERGFLDTFTGVPLYCGPKESTRVASPRG